MNKTEFLLNIIDELACQLTLRNDIDSEVLILDAALTVVTKRLVNKDYPETISSNLLVDILRLINSQN